MNRELLKTTLLGVTLAASSAARAARPAALDPGAAVEALGGLRAPLEAEGWTLTPMRGATVQPGDIADPADQQVQITGLDCFGADAVRRGQGVSASVEQALSLGGKGRGGVVGAHASAARSLQVGIAGAEIAEIPVGSLTPAPACVAQLQVLAGQGYDVKHFQVVQSVLWADLTLASCLEGEAGVKAPGAGAAVSAKDCRGVQGTRAAIAVRTEPVATALALAGVDIEGPPPRVAPPDPGKKRKKKDALPCWLAGPCEPWPADRFLSTTGKGPSMAAADADARARLLAPFELRFRALTTTAGGDEAAGQAAAEAQERMAGVTHVPARHQEGLEFYSLAAIERDPLIAALSSEIRAAEASLGSAEGQPPLAAAQTLCGALPTARRLAFLHAELSALALRPSRPQVPLAERERRCDAALARVRVAVPPDRLGDLLSERLGALGLQTVPFDAEEADLRVVVRSEARTAEVQGFTNVSHDGVAELQAPGQSPTTLNVTASGASKDPAKAKAAAARDLEDQLADAVTGKLQEMLP